MSGVHPDWDAAGEAASRIAAGWDGPGGAIALFGPDGLRGGAAGGLASLEHGVPFTLETPTRYASISKHFMAATLLLSGVDLERSLGSLIPGFEGPLAAVTLGRALDMTAGLPDMMEALWQVGVPYTASLAPETVMRALHRLPGLSAAPGSEMAYCNTGWRLAQTVVAAQCGAEYGAVLRRVLLDPLCLPIRFPLDETEMVPGLATGYWRDGETWRRGRYGMHFSASGGLAGSAADLAAWGGALLSDRFPGLLARLSAPRALANGTPNAYRLGLIESALGGVRVLTHGGSLPGYRNVLLLAPEHGFGVAYLTNREADALPNGLAVMAALLGVAAPEPALDSPTGLFAAAAGPFWAEGQAGALCFMGASEGLVAEGEGWRSLGSSLEMRFRAVDGAIEGRFGGVARRLLPVPPGLPLDPALVGHWRDPAFGAELHVAADGTARFPWPGGLGEPVPLTPLPGFRALASLPHGSWAHRPCLCLQDDGTLQVASHRSRALRFRRS